MPCGTFTLGDHGSNPLVFVSAGVGITPIMSMLDHFGEKYKKGEHTFQTIICIQIKKSPDRHLMKYHIDELVGKGITESHVFYTSTFFRDKSTTVDLKNSHIYTGRIKLETIQPIIEHVTNTAEFYFCGPESFMVDFSTILDGLGIPNNRRHYENFGPPTPGILG